MTLIIEEGSPILLEINNEKLPCIVHSYKDSEIKIKFPDDTIRKFVIDIFNNKLIDENGSCPYILVGSMQCLIDRLLNINTVIPTIWMMLGTEPSECRCLNCIQNEIDFLNYAVLNSPDSLQHNIACKYITEFMIPRLESELRIVSESQELLRMMNQILGDDFDEILQRSFDEEQNRNKSVTEENLSIIVASQKSITSKSCKSCVFCLEEFGVKGMTSFITCPNCSATFCPGSNKDGCCKGLEYHLKNDNRCPVCRINCNEWVQKLSESVETEPSNHYQNSARIEDFVENSSKKIYYPRTREKKIFSKSNLRLNKNRQRFYHKSFSKRQFYGR